MIALLGAAAPAQPASGGGLALLLPLVLMGVVFYFLLIRPQKKKMAQQRSLLDSLEVGDEIVTIGGIIGTLKSIGVDGNDDEVMIEIAPGTEMRFIRPAISRKHVSADDWAQDEDDDDDEPNPNWPEEEQGADKES